MEKQLATSEVEHIVRLCLQMEPEHYEFARQGWNTFYRNMSHNELLLSIMVQDKKVFPTDRDKGVHICVMKNGDFFAREYPYYDGDLDGLMLVYNQREAWQFINSAIERDDAVGGTEG